MQAPLQNKIEIKVYILYVLKNIGYPVEFNKLHDTITADEPVSTFAFSECFSELLDAENVECIVGDDQSEAYMITQKGINVCDGLLYMLIPSVQKTAFEAALRLVWFEQKGIATQTTITRNNECFDFSFTITQKGDQIFNLTLNNQSQQHAAALQEKVNQNPEYFYRSIMALLNG